MTDVQMDAPRPKVGWKIVRFGDVIRQCKEKVDRDNNPFERYVEGGHMDSEDVHLRRWGEFGKDYVGPAFHRVFRKGQVLYGSRRTYLKKVAVAEFDGITANTTFVLETKDQSVFMQELLPFLMLTDRFTEHSVGESKGSTNPYINFPDIAKFEFPLPPIEEQKRIAEILWAADETVESYRKTLYDLKMAHERLFWSLTGGSEVTSENLEDYCVFITDGDHNPPKRVTNGIPHVVVKHIVNDRIVLRDCTFISSLDFQKVKRRYAPKADDLILTCVGTIGRTALVPEGFTFSADRSLALIRFSADKVLPAFGKELLDSHKLQRQLEARSIGTAQKHLYLGDIRKIKVMVPSLTKQGEILGVLRPVEALIEEVVEHLRKAQALRVRLNNTVIVDGTYV